MLNPRTFLVGFGFLILLMCPSFSLAQEVSPETILIKNVRLLDPVSPAEDRAVNILIKENRIEIVSEDSVREAKETLVLDGSNGVVLGALDIGGPASFLILDQNPQENPEILLDTKTHAVFAIHKGNILRNSLKSVVGSEPEAPGRRWFAYTPPPRSYPVASRYRPKWNRWNSRYVSGVFLGAVLLDRQAWLSQDESSSQQVGDLDAFEGGEIRALRFGSVGTLNLERRWIYTFFAATKAFDQGFDSRKDDDFVLFDYRLDIPLTEKLSLAVGKQKEPISMERLVPLAFWPMQERAAALDALLPARNVGIVLSGTGFDRRVTLAGGVFNDWFDAGQSFSESSNQFVGRTTWLPFISADESSLLHLGFGVRYTDGREKQRYRATPEFNQSPVFVDTDLLNADNAMTYNPEVSWRMGPFWLSTEAVFKDVSAPQLDNPLFHGYHISGSWSLTGEMRPYNRRSGVFGQLPVAKPVTEGGLGALELAMRWSNLDLAQKQVEGGELGVLSLGLNWWPVRAASLSANYRYSTLTRFDTTGKSSGLALRLLLMLE
jgi:phosphate-selective porin OprO/OprP